MRQYLVGSWNNADEYQYSGEMLMGHRNGASREVPHFTASGNANVAKYGDNDLTPKTSKVSIKDKILPQFKRLQTLQSQMVELEKEYKTTEMTCEEYSILRDVIVCKIERAEVLYKKATSVRPVREETEEVGEESTYSGCDVHYTHTEVAPSCGVSWIDELPHTNSFKRFLQIACNTTKTLIRCTQATKRYIKTLSEV